MKKGGMDMGEGRVNSGIFDVAFFKNQTECQCKILWISDDGIGREKK